ncbi:MAG: hypothetical protein QE267_03080, partial [Akkermansiaceae bacterium]|nr:hypothetical protein [Akkermansiaceae bacterium]
AAGDAEGGADRSDAMAGGLVDVIDHLPELSWGLVPRMTAAFFKMSFSCLRREFSRRRARVQLPLIEWVTADAEFFGDLGHGLSGVDEFNGLGFELWGVASAWLGTQLG